MIAELFKWKSEDKRLKYIKPFPDVVDL